MKSILSILAFLGLNLLLAHADCGSSVVIYQSPCTPVYRAVSPPVITQRTFILAVSSASLYSYQPNTFQPVQVVQPQPSVVYYYPAPAVACYPSRPVYPSRYYSPGVSVRVRF